MMVDAAGSVEDNILSYNRAGVYDNSPHNDGSRADVYTGRDHAAGMARHEKMLSVGSQIKKNPAPGPVITDTHHDRIVSDRGQQLDGSEHRHSPKQLPHERLGIIQKAQELDIRSRIFHAADGIGDDLGVTTRADDHYSIHRDSP
jgi:hypothetical protein